MVSDLAKCLQGRKLSSLRTATLRIVGSLRVPKSHALGSIHYTQVSCVTALHMGRASLLCSQGPFDAPLCRRTSWAHPAGWELSLWIPERSACSPHAAFSASVSAQLLLTSYMPINHWVRCLASALINAVGSQLNYTPWEAFLTPMIGLDSSLKLQSHLVPLFFQRLFHLQLYL